MKRYYLFIAIAVMFTSCSTKDETPLLKVNHEPSISLMAMVNSGDPITGSKTDISTVRIGELIEFQIIVGANQNSQAPVSQLIISRTIGNAEEILLDTVLQDLESFVRKTFYVSETPATESWSFKIKDKAGYSNQLDQEIQIIDPGLFGRWAAFDFEGDLDPLFAEDGFTQVQVMFKEEHEFYMEYFGDNNIYLEGNYTQSWNEEKQYWEFILDQSAPLPAKFQGICKILTPSPDQIYFYYVQTEPDMGLEIPTEFKPEEDLVPGEHIFTATQIVWGL
ncbi:MAG: hypothetical protein KQI35_09760 [Bacteroidetes bacterium]|nr:hypothetical protein [Bacteroidota bacterium]